MDLKLEDPISAGRPSLNFTQDDIEQLRRVAAATTTLNCSLPDRLMTSTIVPENKSLIVEDLAYATGSGSLASVSSSADDEESDSNDSYVTQHTVDMPTDVDMTSSSTADRRHDKRKKTSCPASMMAVGLGKEDAFQRLALSDDETIVSGSLHSSAGIRIDFGPSPTALVGLPTSIPPYAMRSVTGSNRRRLGQKRSSSTACSTIDGTTTNLESAGTKNVDTVSPSPDVQQPKIGRKPSSLFYLDLIDENEDDDDDEDDDNDNHEKSNFSPSKFSILVGGSGLSSSRKLSAAAYASLVTYYTPDEGDENENADETNDRVEKGGSGHQDVEHIWHHGGRCTRPKRVLTQDDEYDLHEIDAVTKVFRLSDDVYRRMKTLLNADMDRGLQRATHNTATVKMFHTHVRTLPNGSEHGRYMALDLGGTNFRVLLVDLEGHQPPKVVSKVYLIPLRVMLGSGEQLFDHIVKCIAEFLEMNGLEGERFLLGFTFSFPCIQEGLASARLARWTKGFKCSGVEKEDVVKLLHDAIARRENLNVQCIAIINDNVGALMTGAHSDPKCRIGLIIGTGTNCCYLEDLHKVELWDGEMEEPRKMIVNTEWGAFGDDGVLDFARNQFDRRLDVTSLNPGHQLFEKMISGMYMGEIVRLVLCELTLRGLIFRRRDSDQLFEQQRFFTKYISEIESDDPDGDYPNTRIVLEELVKSHPSREECRYVQHVCWQVSQRAAFLAATAVAVVIERLNVDDVTVAVDGSLYRFHPHFKDLMNNKIAQLVGPQQKFKLILAHDGSGQGAALVAALADKTHSRAHCNEDNIKDVNCNKIFEIY